MILQVTELKAKLEELQSKHIIENNEASTSQMREKLIESITDVMDDELQCAICSELIINVSHFNIVKLVSYK